MTTNEGPARSQRAQLQTAATTIALELRPSGAGDLVLCRRSGDKVETLVRVSIGDEEGLMPSHIDLVLGEGVSVLMKSKTPASRSAALQPGTEDDHAVAFQVVGAVRPPSHETSGEEQV